MNVAIGNGGDDGSCGNRIGVRVIGGYLGSGKTTLVNHLLQHAAGARLAVLVNDFGSIAIDAGLIVSRSATVISLSGGCVCCSYGSDLVAALQSLVGSAAAPEAILIETSGVALPRIVLQSACLVPGMAAHGVTVVADAETLLARAADRYLADTVTRQVEDADTILLNKIDLVTADAAGRAEEWIRKVNPVAGVVRTERSRVSLETLFADLGSRHGGLRNQPMRDSILASQQYRSEEFMPDGAVDVEWLARELARPERRLLRAKGVLKGRNGALLALQVAGERFEVCSAGVAARSSQVAEGLGLVCIGRAGDIDRAALARLIDKAAIR